MGMGTQSGAWALGVEWGVGHGHWRWAWGKDMGMGTGHLGQDMGIEGRVRSGMWGAGHGHWVGVERAWNRGEVWRVGMGLPRWGSVLQA